MNYVSCLNHVSVEMKHLPMDTATNMMGGTNVAVNRMIYALIFVWITHATKRFGQHDDHFQVVT